MATITINGEQLEAEEGRPLVEVIKEHGVAITNLCYIDGLAPFAGCRTCLVEIEGARPTSLQLSCTAIVADGMVVETETALARETRQSVMSMIMANHPDRCLTCHRRVHCAPGEICLRDDVITHRCLTCAKNYRCELQTSCELIDMGEFEEPWVGERRSYYETPPPEPDRGNPFLEFDPQMCILCTRCVRACADLRHTGAISFAGKGDTTVIAFGTGGAIHQSDCDFCGACIDVCPTATLMEKPNKWAGNADDWTSSVCNSCSVGCTLSYGVTGGRPVIVRPDRVNPVSRDQICVRGRFHYAAAGDRLTRSLVRTGDRLLPASFDDAIARAVEVIEGVTKAAGAEAVAVLGSPLATNEEAHLLVKLARDVIGTPHLDFSHGPTHRAVAGVLRDAFGTDRLPASLTDIEHAATIVVVGGDIEQSHPVVSLRVKDAVVKRGAKLVLVSSRWGELVTWAKRSGAWLQPAPGHEARTVQALAEAIGDAAAALPGDLDGAAEAIAAARDGAAGDGGFAVVFAPDAIGADVAAEQARASANLVIAARGDAGAHSLHYLPTDANVNGIAQIGVAPAPDGKSFPEIIAAAKAGEIKVIVLHDDNPLLNAAGSDDVRAAFQALEALIVIDSVRSTAVEHATVVLAELPFHGKDGTITNADHRLLRQRPATVASGDERDGASILLALANGLGDPVRFDGAAEVMAEIAGRVSGYVTYDGLNGSAGLLRTIDESAALSSRAQAVGDPPAADGEGLRVITGRSLYTSWEGASSRSEQADELQREQHVLINPRDAEAASIRTDDEVVLVNGSHEVRIRARLDDGVAPGTVYVPQYYDGGAVMALYPLEGTGAPVARVRVRALEPA